MQKIKNPILCWIVILAVFIRPTPAQAVVPLAAVAVGAVIAATGVMVAGAGVYKPPTFAQANAAVDSVTGDITRKVIVARAFADGLSSGLRGYAGQYTLDFAKAKQWVIDHAASFPSLKPAFDTTDVPQAITPYTGFVYLENGVAYQISSLSGFQYGVTNWDLSMAAYLAAQPFDMGGGMRRSSVSSSYVRWNPRAQGSYIYFDVAILTKVAVSLSPTAIPTTSNPSALAAAFPNTEAGQDETDRIAAENPAAIKSEPVPFSPEQIQEAMKQAEKEMLDSAADTAEIQAAADPTNTALQIAAQQARVAADQATIQAEAAKAEVETKPEEEAKTDTLPPAGPALDADLVLDFSPFLGLQDKAMSKFPFSMVSSLGSLFSGLTSAPVTPSMDVPMPWGIAPKQITLSHWDDFAGKWRMMIALFFHASCIYAIIRRYS